MEDDTPTPAGLSIGWYISDTHARRAVNHLAGQFPELVGVDQDLLDRQWATALEETLRLAERSPIGPEAGYAAAPEDHSSVQPDWCRQLTYQQQSVLLLAARGPDGIAKAHPCKEVVRAYRATVFRAARYGRSLEYGEHADTFMSLGRFEADWDAVCTEFFEHHDSLPHHYLLHLAHGAEILGYKHPLPEFRRRWLAFYRLCCYEWHLTPETEAQLDERLNDWARAEWPQQPVTAGHHVVVRTAAADRRWADDLYRAECSCGWHGAWFCDPQAANDQAQLHEQGIQQVVQLETDSVTGAVRVAEPEPVQDHQLRVESNQWLTEHGPLPVLYHAACSCGWRSPQFASPAGAEGQARLHAQAHHVTLGQPGRG